MHNTNRVQNGFTLIEVVVVIAIMGVVFVGLSGLSSGMFTRGQLHTESDRVMETLQRAQARSIAQREDDVWGVHFTGTDMTLFKGDDFATRDPSFDEAHDHESSVQTSGLTDVIFTLRTGKTDDTGTLTITSTPLNQSIDIVINAQGRINRQ